MDWITVLQKLADVQRRPKGRGNYYLRKLRALAEAGFKLATPDMAALYDKAVEPFPEDQDVPSYNDVRHSTYPEIRKTEPNQFGLYAYGTHDRSERIDDAIESLAELHAADIEAGRAWLMPVDDDEEYVSWEFDVAVGSEEEVLAALRAMPALVQTAVSQKLGY